MEWSQEGDFQYPKLTALGKFMRLEENLTEPLQGLIGAQIKRFLTYVRAEHISLKCRKTIEGLVGYEVQAEIEAENVAEK